MTVHSWSLPWAVKNLLSSSNQVVVMLPLVLSSNPNFIIVCPDNRDTQIIEVQIREVPLYTHIVMVVNHLSERSAYNRSVTW